MKLLDALFVTQLQDSCLLFLHKNYFLYICKLICPHTASSRFCAFRFFPTSNHFHFIFKTSLSQESELTSSCPTEAKRSTSSSSASGGENSLRQWRIISANSCTKSANLCVRSASTNAYKWTQIFFSPSLVYKLNGHFWGRRVSVRRASRACPGPSDFWRSFWRSLGAARAAAAAVGGCRAAEDRPADGPRPIASDSSDADQQPTAISSARSLNDTSYIEKSKQ